MRPSTRAGTGSEEHRRCATICAPAGARAATPPPRFLTAEYLAAHPFLRHTDINPFLHYLQTRLGHGVDAIPRPDARRAARLARRLIDPDYYLAGNPDLRRRASIRAITT